MQVVGRASRLTAAAALLIGLAACADSPDAAGPDPSPPASATSPSPSDTSPTTDSEGATAAAEEMVRKYYLVRNELRQQPTKPLRLLRSVSTSTDLAAQEAFLRTQRRAGHRQIGDTRIVGLTVQSVDLDNSDPKAGRVPTVVIDVCYDVGDVDIVDGNGESVVPENRPERGVVRHSVANYRWKADPADGWRVASSETLEDEPCAGS